MDGQSKPATTRYGLLQTVAESTLQLYETTIHRENKKKLLWQTLRDF